ncbi:hypothetical protein LTR17_001007 [Elasticomyces elasticus]|nr:hypothetical protein LTR17_001007 [Elasticomyces elasticus]
MSIAKLETTASDTKKLLMFYKDDLVEARDTIDHGVIHAAKLERERGSLNKAILDHERQLDTVSSARY